MYIDKPVKSRPAAAQWGSDHIADVMRALGIEHIALTPGASYRGLHDSLVNYLGNAKPSMLLALHEESAVAIAHGYAKITGKPLGVLLHSNVGLMHASMAIFNAWCERVPMLIYGGNGPMDASVRRPWVDWTHTCTDQAALVRHFIKWDNQPASLPATAEAMLRAAMIARTPPCAPTYVIFDSTLQEAKLDRPIPIPDVARFQPPPSAYPAPEVLRAAASMLAQAKQPLILAGRGSRSLEAWRDRIALAELLGARVLTSLRTSAAFPSDHPLHAGPPIKFISDFAIETIASSDVILSLDWIDLAGIHKQVWRTDGSVSGSMALTSRSPAWRERKAPSRWVRSNAARTWNECYMMLWRRLAPERWWSLKSWSKRNTTMLSQAPWCGARNDIPAPARARERGDRVQLISARSTKPHWRTS